MKYICTMRIWGSFVTEVEADNAKEAEKKADEAWQNADFGDATDLDGEVIRVEEDKDK